MKLHALSLFAGLLAATALHAADPAPSGQQVDGAFTKVVLDSDQMIDGAFQDTLKDPMELAVAKDGRVFYAERNGIIKMWKPDSKSAVVIANIPVFSGLEDGMLGITLDPNFDKNGWVYLNHSLPETTKDSRGEKQGIIRVSRYTLKGDQLGLASEKAVIDITTQREQCCHVGGSLGFDAHGNLYIAIGDNTNPFDSEGFSPHDQRSGRSPWDSQKSSANMNDLRGGISRIHPEPDGTYTIPKGNLFPPGTPGTRPEVYVKGTRNGFRLSVDQRTGILYWGDVGPDAGTFDPKRGPAGFDAVMQAKQPGFFGWPYSRGDNKPYAKVDFDARDTYMRAKAEYDGKKAAYDKAVKEAKTSGQPAPAPFALKPPTSFTSVEPIMFDPAKPVNTSPNNTGIKELPPVQPRSSGIPAAPRPASPLSTAAAAAPRWPVPCITTTRRTPRRPRCPRSMTTPCSSTSGAGTGSSPCISTRTTTSPATPTAPRR